MSKDPFNYAVSYPRTANWYNGDWAALSYWCNESIGECTVSWEYINQKFLFVRERDKVLFILKWKFNE